MFLLRVLSSMHRRYWRVLLLLCCSQLAAAQTAPRPNFLVIVADDLGFSDIGAFGGEIATPNLDRLAHAGLRMTDFHTAAACSPTRAMLMTGVDHHRAGIANMAELRTPRQQGQPGYAGHLGDNVVTLAELLRDAGYFTVMSGKWHLGLAPEQNPARRGFLQSWALLPGGENHFGRPSEFPASMRDALYSENGQPLTPDSLPADYYSSNYFTDRLLGYLRAEADSASHRPFFAYLAFTAPHWPLQAPAAAIEKYRGRYAAGWDALRSSRLERQRELGVLAAGATATAPSTLADWSALAPEEQARQARLMEIYAAMVDTMDANIGRVVEYLRSSGQLDNTVIVFLSDNGAEGGNAARQTKLVTGKDLPRPDFAELGGANALASYGPNWAQAATAPFRLYKSNATEGGIRVPAIIHYPGFSRRPGIDRSFVTAMDIAPTLLELAGAEHPGRQYRGRSIEPMQGTSMVPYLQQRSPHVHPATATTGWELFGQRALRQGQWKIAYISQPNGSGHWELYDLAADPGERHDRAGAHPRLLATLIAAWEKYAVEQRIVLDEQMISPYSWQ